ncbi:hypothetical protein P3T20_002269 [Paraburkholderia sp. GAS206C]|jgi:hypothetical protein
MYVRPVPSWISSLHRRRLDFSRRRSLTSISWLNAATPLQVSRQQSPAFEGHRKSRSSWRLTNALKIPRGSPMTTADAVPYLIRPSQIRLNGVRKEKKADACFRYSRRSPAEPGRQPCPYPCLATWVDLTSPAIPYVTRRPGAQNGGGCDGYNRGQQGVGTPESVTSLRPDAPPFFLYLNERE